MSDATETTSCLYFGKVMHKRLRPFGHRLAYRVFSLYLDLDELPALSRKLRFFSHNRWNLFSFLDRDHGTREAGGAPGANALRPWIEQRLAEAGIDLKGGAVGPALQQADIAAMRRHDLAGDSEAEAGPLRPRRAGERLKQMFAGPWR